MSVYLAGFCQLDTNRGISGKRYFQLRNCTHQIDLQASLWGVFSLLMIGMGGQSTVGGVTTRQMIMVYIRKGDEQVMRSKPGISSFSRLQFLPLGSRLSSWSDFPQCWTVTWTYKSNDSFP